MNISDAKSTSTKNSLEREKWDMDCAFRERELLVKERECHLKESELYIRKAEHESSHWKNPLIVAIFAAAVAALGNAVVVYINAHSQTMLEAQKSEHERILEMIKTGNPDNAAENLLFLLDAGLIVDHGIREKLTEFLKQRKPGTGPVLPSIHMPSDAVELISKHSNYFSSQPIEVAGRYFIGFDHMLTKEETETGIVYIDGEPVNVNAGITFDQAKWLLEEELKPYRQYVEELVTVELTNSQKDALASFVFNIGTANFRTSTLLKKLNSGRYEAVPEEFRRWTKSQGKAAKYLIDRREDEIVLWTKP